MSHEPTDYSPLVIAFYMAIGALGGLVNKLQRWTGGEPPHCWKCALARLATELITSGFIGLLTLFACDELGISRNWTAICTATAGHMGCRAIFIIERALVKRLTKIEICKIIDDDDSDEKK